MNVTRDVVKDLITIYLAGEASSDTRALVEEYLEHDAELASDVAAARAESLRLPPTSALPPTAEKEALEKTRQMIKTRTSTLVVATLFSILPLSFAFKGSTITFLVIRDAPTVGLAWWATAAAMWVWHLGVRRRLRVSGL